LPKQCLNGDSIQPWHEYIRTHFIFTQQNKKLHSVVDEIQRTIKRTKEVVEELKSNRK